MQFAFLLNSSSTMARKFPTPGSPSLMQANAMVRGMGRGYGNTQNSRLKPYLPLDTSTMFACQYFVQKIKSYTRIVQHSKQYLTKVPFSGFILYTQQLELLCTASKASPWKALFIATVGSRISFTNSPNSRFQLNDPVTLRVILLIESQNQLVQCSSLYISQNDAQQVFTLMVTLRILLFDHLSEFKLN